MLVCHVKLVSGVSLEKALLSNSPAEKPNGLCKCLSAVNLNVAAFYPSYSFVGVTGSSRVKVMSLMVV